MRYIVQSLKFKIQSKGFTLIELLVVITIMGILMGILLVSYQGARVSARDGKRKADLEQIRSALQMYHSDLSTYPDSNEIVCKGTLSEGGNTYMTEIPCDPLSGADYTYKYNLLTEHTYALCAFLEGGSGTVSDCGGDCGDDVDCNYKVSQP